MKSGYSPRWLSIFTAIAIQFSQHEIMLQSVFSSKLVTPIFISAAICGVATVMWTRRCMPQQPASTRKLDKELVLSLAQSSHFAGNDSAFPLLGTMSIVTGGTSGLGKEIVAELFALGATVVLASRNEAKSLQVIKEIEAEYPSSKGSMVFETPIDTGSLESVKQFAQWFLSKYRELHILVNNAGIHYVSYSETVAKGAKDKYKSVDGYDKAFATNYLGHFLLTKLLTPVMLKTEQESGKGGRIINVASSYHAQSDGTMLDSNEDGSLVPLAARSDINTNKHRIRAYSNNKLAQVLHAKELQKQINSRQNEFSISNFDNGGKTINTKVFSTCPAWASTEILGNSIPAQFVAHRAFPAKAAIIAQLGAILDTSRFKGGEFITNFKNDVANQWWAKGFFYWITKLGVRDAAVTALSMYILMTQNRQYGYQADNTSPEGEDEGLARRLYKWSDLEVQKYM